MRRRISVALLLAALCLLFVLPSAGVAGPSRARAADKNGNKVLDDLDQRLKGKKGDDQIDVIALFAGGSSHAEAVAAEEEIGTFDVEYEYTRLSGIAARMTVSQVEALAARSETVQIQANSRIDYSLNSARAAVGVDKATADFGEDGNNENSTVCPELTNYCRDDVVVAVLDTGIYSGHVDLNQGKVIGGTSCGTGTCGPSTWLDSSGHGTASASIIAGEGEESYAHRGVAPGAALVAVKTGDGGGTTIAAVDAGIEWTIANRELYGIDILNMSLNGTSPSDGTDSTSRLTNQAAAAGILPVSASGNRGPAYGSLSFPSAAKYSLATGAVADPDDTDGGNPLGFSLFVGSGRGPTLDGRIKPDVVAPGLDITAAKIGSGYSANSGTSEAAPMVAGIAALALDADPTLGISGTACDPADTSEDCLDGVIDSTMDTSLKDLITSTAIDWGSPGQDVEYGHGLVDGYAAVDAASPQTGTGGPQLPEHTRLSGTVAGSGGTSNTPLTITRTDDPIAVTLLWDRANGATSPNYDLALLNPSGAQVAFSAYGANLRQETVGFQPTVAGTYTIRVISNSGAGPYTLDVSFPGDAAPPPPTPPAAPNLTATARSASQIDLAWTDVESEAGYRLERSIDGQTWQLIASPVANVASHSDNGLNPGMTYYYRVLATNNAGDSPWSNVTSARTLTPPAAPSGLTASAQSSTQINLSWADVTDESTYKVQRSANGTTGWSQIGTTAANVTSFANTGLAASTTYWYRVIASNATGDSPASTSASATTLSDTIAPTIPTNVKATNGKGKITLTWTASTDGGGSGLQGYKVYRATTQTGVYSIVGTVTTNSFVNTTAKGVTYWYYVVAYDKAGNHSAASSKVSGRAT